MTTDKLSPAVRALVENATLAASTLRGANCNSRADKLQNAIAAVEAEAQQPTPTVNGISLRDWFAGQVVAGMFADPSRENEALQERARISYAQADAMLKAREGK